MTDITTATNEQLLDSFGVTYPFSQKTQSHRDVRQEILWRMKLSSQSSDAATRPMPLQGNAI